ncbi:family 78 glycoside hydrolase catalytic domain [Microbacterium sp. YY-01]|uniref:family 78 glycoside hydrolase catalytic domain n=1 Tax=Microbacterium sp. YY-01 TaxID=3421634 RepID=UPI003D16E8D7
MSTVAPVTFEHNPRPLGIGTPRPRLSWKTTAAPAWQQTAYEVRIQRAGTERVFGPIASNESVLVDWPDEPLASRERAEVSVRVTGHDGAVSGWSTPAAVEAGLLEAGDWHALAVGSNANANPLTDTRRPAIVRRDFTVRPGLTRARLYVTAHGIYEVEINGARIDDHALAPGWTTYHERLRYYTHDITEALRNGDNAIGAWLGDGWYRGRLGWRGGHRNLYGTDQSLLAQLELHYDDGTVERVVTDTSWRAADSPIISSSLYDGEHYDARVMRELRGWSEPGFDDSQWYRVVAAHRDPATLVAPEGPPVRCTQEVAPVEVITTPSGARVLDFGQNLVGRVRLRATAPEGTTVVLRTAEVMQEGELYQRPLRDAKSTDTYIFAGDGEEEWEPRFTFHGFRYVEVDGWHGDLDADVAAGALVARVYHSDMERTGWFESSDPLVNRLHENVVWSMRGNFVDIPTDCPQRDERLGWTGDIQVFAPTATFLYDVSGFLSTWLKDLAVEQLPDGTVPWYVPVIPADTMWTPIRPGAAWGDAATLTPWAVYERYGDEGVLNEQYESAKKWVDLVADIAGDDLLWNTGYQLGDWLDPDAPPHDPADAKTDRYLVASGYFARSTQALADFARVLGRSGDADNYSALAARVREAFTRAYVHDDGTMTSDAQTAYALALSFDLIPHELREAVGARLAELVDAADGKISTGFVGTPLVSDALTTTGHTDAAYKLLLNREAPGWLYAVLNGGTTIWERWDSMRPDGTVNPGGMTSFNHYALGAVADWLHRTVAGLAPAAPGYRRIRFAPQPGGGLTSASAAHETPYGRAAIEWTIIDATFTVTVEVPTGTTAELVLPDGTAHELTSGAHTVSSPYNS